ncbi:acyltransferase [uncultured Pseudomonas sp.]|uniref:acyltransferase n=1 Tax=uncultured Pseudomonas sp. TaxID=114707 RepID=UPI0025DEC0BB|nr:acyltransferase [uncultured Pseudomonas sp.]
MNPFDVGYYTEHELRDFGFKSLGSNVLIAKNCTILGLHNISIGNDVRIDGYTTIVAGDQGGLTLGSFIHIGGYSLLSAGAGITMEDFSGLSQGVRIYSRTDDYTGRFLTNPTVDPQYTGVTAGPVRLGRHVIIGSGTVILPNLSIGEGSSVGALSLVSKDLPEWGVYFGTPAKKLKDRKKDLLELEKDFLASRAAL